MYALWNISYSINCSAWEILSNLVSSFVCEWKWNIFLLMEWESIHINIFFSLLFSLSLPIQSILIFFCALYQKKEISIFCFFCKLIIISHNTHTYIQPVLSYKIKKKKQHFKMKMCDIFLLVHVFVFFFFPLQSK